MKICGLLLTFWHRKPITRIQPTQEFQHRFSFHIIKNILIDYETIFPQILTVLRHLIFSNKLSISIHFKITNIQSFDYDITMLRLNKSIQRMTQKLIIRPNKTWSQRSLTWTFIENLIKRIDKCSIESTNEPASHDVK